jgi:hypothetical protein
VDILAQVALIGFAGFAAARVVTIEQVAAAPVNWVLSRLVEFDPAGGVDTADERVAVTLAAETIGVDLRAATATGDTIPRSDRDRVAAAQWAAAQLLTCPSCLTWWTTLAAHVMVDGNVLAWSWWVVQGAGWAVGSQLGRMPWNARP